MWPQQYGCTRDMRVIAPWKMSKSYLNNGRVKDVAGYRNKMCLKVFRQDSETLLLKRQA